MFSVPIKFEGKFKGKKRKRRNRKKEKVKKKKDLKLINYFYILLKIYFIYFPLLNKD